MTDSRGKNEHDHGPIIGVVHSVRCAKVRTRPRLTFDLDVDVCVVGGGIAGLSVALEAAKLGATVAVLEQRQVTWNASGYNIGTVSPGFGGEITDLIARVAASMIPASCGG